MSILRMSARRNLQRTHRKFLSSTKYRGAEVDRLRADWIFGESGPDVDPWEQLTLRERARDLVRNDTVASGAVDTMADNVVGYGLMPQARVDEARLGINQQQAMELNEAIETIFSDWADNADVSERLSFEDMQHLAARQVVFDGEVFVKRSWHDPETASWRDLGTCFELIESDQVESPTDKLEEAPNGIAIGSRNQPMIYYFRTSSGNGTRIEYDHLPISARDSKGRPNVLHLYHQKRIGQQRGHSWFAPAMTIFKDRADYLEAEVVTARVLACLSVFIRKQFPADAASAATFYGGSQQTDAGGEKVEVLEPGLVHYLGFGEDIVSVDPKRPGGTFDMFMLNILRSIGASLNLPYEILMKDFSKTNYSSARAALLEAWRFFMRLRKWLIRRLCKPVYELVLEEAFLRDMLPYVQNFDEQRKAICRAAWIGPGRGWVDPLKEVKSSIEARKERLTTLADEAAQQGKDWQEILEQAAREEQFANEVGAPFPQTRQPTSEVEDADTEEE